MAEQLPLMLPDPVPGLVQLWTPDEIYDRLSNSNLGTFREDRRVEWKGPGIQPKALAEYLSMWANTQPHGGIVVLGIDNSGKKVGCAGISHERRNELNSLSHFCPDARWAAKELPFKNESGSDDFLMVYRVNYRPDKLVETTSGEAFIREGDNKLRISEALKRELRISKARYTMN